MKKKKLLETADEKPTLSEPEVTQDDLDQVEKDLREALGDQCEVVNELDRIRLNHEVLKLQAVWEYMLSRLKKGSKR